MICLRRMVVALAALAALGPGIAEATTPLVGVYYYPGWRDNVTGNRAARPWDSIRPYPDREPLLGFYNEGDVSIMDRQLGWMAEAGLRFVAFDWYWNHQLGALQTHALEAYFQAPNRAAMKFVLLWANHTEFPQSQTEFAKMARFWTYYFRRPEYLKIGGKPVLFVFSAAHLEERALKFNSRTPELLAAARRVAVEAGFAGLFLVGGAGAQSEEVAKFGDPRDGGYDAFSAYNYHGPGTYRYPGGRRESRSFAELDDGYRDHWKWMVDNARAPYVVPMTSGWDRRPWGGSPDPLHDNSLASAEEFEAHLRAARTLIDGRPEKTLRMGVICCWNEYGEGSFIEPTRRKGKELLERVRAVFGR